MVDSKNNAKQGPATLAEVRAAMAKEYPDLYIRPDIAAEPDFPGFLVYVSDVDNGAEGYVLGSTGLCEFKTVADAYAWAERMLPSGTRFSVLCTELVTRDTAGVKTLN